MSKALDPLLERWPWTRELDAGQLSALRRETLVRDIPAEALVCRKGERVEYWIGVIDGLVKIGTVSTEGKPVTLTGVSAGGWLGEGSLLKDETRRYDVVALRDSRIAYVPRTLFHRLLDSNIAFNRFLITQLNERLGLFIATLEHQRMLGPDARAARCIAHLFNPVLCPGSGPELKISQSEIGHLSGLSRQRANQALHTLEARGLIRISYGGITVLDLAGLAAFGDESGDGAGA